MTPERWEKVKEILATALETPPAERRQFLDKSCAGDDELRREVELLLAGEQQVKSQFLGQTALAEAAAAILPQRESPWIGQRVGAYQIVEQIGEGGMGEVYRAFRADDQYRKEVALKFVRASQDSKFVVARFKHERQVLASLDHPNIARLLDGGTTEHGLPYFVMELIKGEPLNDYCDNHKLQTAERLKLFLQVCAAVQYAHQRLIIHRDIKPSNILVTEDGTPKLLDFGIAKIMDTDLDSQVSEPTISMFRLLTPSYASPEQIKGEAITTASDVYSLGVLLYELLTGRHPYETAGRAPHEMARAVCEFEPEKPSTIVRKERGSDASARGTKLTPASLSAAREGTREKLSRILRGDLDNIVLMALRKEPEKRYASVEQLAADISRHLENLPVEATRGSSWYRGRKFILRHKAAVGATLAISAVLIVGVAITLREAQIARAERARAEQRFRDMRELARSNLFEFHDAIQNLPGSAPARNLVIQRALGYLDKLSRDEGSDRGLMQELAAGYERVAALENGFSGPGMGDIEAARSSYAKAFAIRESLIASSGSDPRELKAQCDLIDGYIEVLQESGKTQQAVQIAGRGLDLANLLVQKQPTDPEAIADEAEAHLQMGIVMGGHGSGSSTRQLPEAIMHEQKAVELLTSLLTQSHDSQVLGAAARANWILGYHLRKNRQFDESLKIYDGLWSMSQDLRLFPTEAQLLLYNHRSRLFDDRNDFKHAYDDERRALAIAESMVRVDPGNLQRQSYAAIDMGALGLDEARLGNKVAGKKKLDIAIAGGERMLSANPHLLYYKYLLLEGYACQGEILSSMGKQAEAREKYSQALTMAAGLAQDDPDDFESPLSIAKLHVNLGVVLARAKRYPESQQELKSALSRLGEFLALRPQDAEGLYVSGVARNSLSMLKKCSAATACTDSQSMQLVTLNN